MCQAFWSVEEGKREEITEKYENEDRKQTGKREFRKYGKEGGKKGKKEKRWKKDKSIKWDDTNILWYLILFVKKNNF